MDKKTFRAHARVNLIGEHTDYNGGWVLPTAIPLYTEAVVEKVPGDSVIIKSSGMRSIEYKLGSEMRTGEWSDYVQGVTKYLKESAKRRGQYVEGFKAEIISNIPEGSGLSSSAALEMSLLHALKKLFALHLDNVELALLGQKVENEFVGARVGIMDQMATSLAEEGEALFLDTLELTYERIKLPMDEMDLLVINSGISHRLSDHDGGYNERRFQCEEVCRLLGIHLLRNIDQEELQKSDLPPILMKRARHVLSENLRVINAVRAIKNKDLSSLGELLNQSHQSMKNDFEISIPEIDLLVELCLEQKDTYGARLTGGGFGGSIVAITKKGSKNEIAKKVLSSYHKKTKEHGEQLL